MGNWLEGVLERLSDWYHGFLTLFPNLLAAGVVILLFGLGARLARRLVPKAVSRLPGRAPGTHLHSLAGTLAYIAVLALGVVAALDLLGWDRALTSVLAGAGILGLALAFAFQDIASNLIAGVTVSVRCPFAPGDFIESGEYRGRVQEVNLRSTVIRTTDGLLVMIPNSVIYQKPIVNYTRRGRRRVDVHCGISFRDDLSVAKRLACEAVATVPGRDASRPVEFFYERFGESSIDFVVRFWIPFTTRERDLREARSEAIVRVKQSFDENSITIPFPVHTVDISAHKLQPAP